MKKSVYLLIICLLCVQFTVFADESIKFVSDLGIMTGYPDGDFGENNPITRAELAKITTSINNQDVPTQSNVSPYNDVPYTHWASAYIDVATKNNYFTGYPNGDFMPENNILYEELCKVILNMLGYTEQGQSYSWAESQINQAKKIGLLNNVDYTIGASASRLDTAKILRNALLTMKKDTNQYLIENMQFKYLEDVIIVSDKSVQSGYVSTSVGVFKKNSLFDASYINQKGDLIINKNKEIVVFLPTTQEKDEYIVKSVLPNSIAVFGTSQDSEIDFADETKVYSSGTETNYAIIKPTLSIGDKLTVYKDEYGQTSYISVEKDALSQPAHKSSFNISDSTKIIRDGMTSNKNEIEALDICYYIKETNTLLVYSKKITGVYENAMPNKDNIKSIMLSGKQYEVGYIDAYNKLSLNGNIAYGETITALFGKDGKIVDIIAISETEKITGFLLDTGLRDRIDENGEKNVEYTASVLLTDGSISEYSTSKDYEDLEGKTVDVSFSGGKANLSSLSPNNNISGTFDWDKKTLGKFDISDNANIIDVADNDNYTKGKGMKIFPQRLNNVVLNEKDILYIRKNSNGVICDLILNDVTNDLYQYGMVLKDERVTSPLYMLGTYELNIEGKELKISTPNALYPVYTGQSAMFDFDITKVVRMQALTKFNKQIVNLDDSYIYTNSEKYSLSSNVLVYRKLPEYTYETRYELIPVSKIKKVETITAYYDKDENKGGKIRTIVVE